MLTFVLLLLKPALVVFAKAHRVLVLIRSAIAIIIVKVVVWVNPLSILNLPWGGRWYRRIAIELRLLPMYIWHVKGIGILM